MLHSWQTVKWQLGACQTLARIWSSRRRHPEKLMNAMKYTRKMQHGSGWQRARQGCTLFSELFNSILEAIMSFKQIWKGQTMLCSMMVNSFRFTGDTDLITTDEAEFTQNDSQGSVGIQKNKRLMRRQDKKMWKSKCNKKTAIIITETNRKDHGLWMTSVKEQGSWRRLKCGRRAGLAVRLLWWCCKIKRLKSCPYTWESPYTHNK